MNKNKPYVKTQIMYVAVILVWIVLNAARATEAVANNLLGLSVNPLKFGKTVLEASSSIGECKKGAQYRLSKISDFFRYRQDLECIFASGLPPISIGLGFYSGQLLTAGFICENNRIFFPA